MLKFNTSTGRTLSCSASYYEFPDATRTTEDIEVSNKQMTKIAQTKGANSGFDDSFTFAAGDVTWVNYK